MNSEFILKYPSDSGFEKTEIYFYSGNPNLENVFSSKGGSETLQPRLFVTDTTVASLPSLSGFISLFEGAKIAEGAVLKRGSDFLLVLGAGEKFKTIESVLLIVRTALERNFTRQSTFVAIGGGVISDMTAFAASIFKRGINVEFVPTTLLSMVDASVGGKSGCDIEGFKNMIGSFWPASKLYVWSDFVLSLPHSEYVSGLSEAIKTALLFNAEMLAAFEQNRDAVLKRDSGILQTVIGACVRAKAEIVQEDPKEKGRRAFLNLGHTFGHALECAAGLGRITHGEAVAWGMGRAADLASLMGLCPPEFAKRTKALLGSYGYDCSPYPEVLSGTDKAQGIKTLIGAMKKDKKNTDASQIRVTLQKGECDTVIANARDCDIEAVLGKGGSSL